MSVSKTHDHIQIKIKMLNPNQEPPGSFTAPNEALKDTDVLCTFKIKIENQNLVVLKTSDHIQIKIKMPNPSQKPPASSKTQKEAFKDIYVLCTFKIKIENPDLDHGCMKDQ